MEGDKSGGWRDKNDKQDVVRIAEYYERSSISDTLWAVPPDQVHAWPSWRHDSARAR